MFICQKIVIKTNFYFLVVKRRVYPVRVFKILGPTLTTTAAAMDWKGYVVAIAVLLSCKGRNSIFDCIKNLGKRV